MVAGLGRAVFAGLGWLDQRGRYYELYTMAFAERGQPAKKA